jgi:hypothetical protein
MRTEILSSLLVFAFASLAHIHLEQLLPCCYVELLKCHASCSLFFQWPGAWRCPLERKLIRHQAHRRKLPTLHPLSFYKSSFQQVLLNSIANIQTFKQEKKQFLFFTTYLALSRPASPVSLFDRLMVWLRRGGPPAPMRATRMAFCARFTTPRPTTAAVCVCVCVCWRERELSDLRLLL